MTKRTSVLISAENFDFSGNTISIKNKSFQYDETLVNLLGIGSFGAVFCGTDFRLNCKEFIKNNTEVDTLVNNNDIYENKPSSSKSNNLKNQVAIKKVARINLKPHELRAMKRVCHPNLVRLIDVCDADSENESDKKSPKFDTFTYLIMEMCDNDLDKHLKYHAENQFLRGDDLRLINKTLLV